MVLYFTFQRKSIEFYKVLPNCSNDFSYWVLSSLKPYIGNLSIHYKLTLEILKKSIARFFWFEFLVCYVSFNQIHILARFRVNSYS